MSPAEKIAEIKTFLADRVEDRHLAVDGDDTDTLFIMLDAALAAADNPPPIGGSFQTSVT